jgi:hypothetical protein
MAIYTVETIPGEKVSLNGNLVGQTGHHYENMRLNSYIPCSRMSR